MMQVCCLGYVSDNSSPDNDTVLQALAYEPWQVYRCVDTYSCMGLSSIVSREYFIFGEQSELLDC